LNKTAAAAKGTYNVGKNIVTGTADLGSALGSAAINSALGYGKPKPLRQGSSKKPANYKKFENTVAGKNFKKLQENPAAKVSYNPLNTVNPAAIGQSGLPQASGYNSKYRIGSGVKIGRYLV
jgi:hypothetical protein